jgi:DNA gyrase subunit A
MSDSPPDAIRRRLEIVEGLLRALEKRGEVDAAIEQSSDRVDACRRLTGGSLQFSDVQAHHILDVTLGRRTKLGEEELRREQRKLEEDLRRASAG